MAEKFFVTTALPYANGPFHIGHIMEYIQADIWVRFQRMQGNQVFRHAVVNIAEAVVAAADAAGIEVADVDWFIPHQANQRILEGVGRRLGIDSARVISTVERHANTSAASIPLAWAEAVDDGRVKPGQLLLWEAMGGGLTWGAAVVRL